MRRVSLGPDVAFVLRFGCSRTDVRPHCVLWWKTETLVFVFMTCIALCLGQEQTPSITYNIEEGLPVGTQVGDISVDQQIAGPYLSVHVPADYLEFTQDGIITTKAVLDHEQESVFDFFALPITPNPPQIAIRVSVTDVNDNSPVFPNSEIDLDLSESTPIGAKRSLDSARDADDGIFSTQGYRILSGNVDNKFELDFRTAPNGEVFLDLVINDTLDRETTPNYTLVIEAYDGASPPRLGNMTVNVNILDINDNPPVFAPTRYSSTVNETLAVGSPILQVTASDADEGINGAVMYEVLPQSDPNEIFGIDPNTGWLYLNKELDHELFDSIVLVIMARDSATQPERSYAYATINILNVNEQPPNINIVFLSEDGEPKISEAAVPGDFVARVSVNDPDEGDLTNVNVTLIGGEGTFGIMTRNNIIYLICLQSSLDRELIPSYDLSITARDFGIPPLHTQVDITIYVEDINDNPPIFDEVEYSASILEIVERGSMVTQVHADDADAGMNAAVTYQIVNEPGSYSEWFTINSESGLITTDQLIDRETVDTVRLTVQASDAGIPSFSANVTVVISLRDVNDNQPQFLLSSYNASIPEDTNINTCFLQVQAEDPDSGNFGLVTYSLSLGYGSQPPPEFYIQSDDGYICTATQLDRDAGRTSLEFPVQATDGGGLSSIALVKITLLDVNDNRPVFYPSTYAVDVDESSPEGTVITTVSAQDQDSGTFGRVTYSILSGNSQGIFSVADESGVITLIGTLSRQQQSLHFLEVSAVDGGGQSSLDNAQISISVVGPDDSPPMFNQSHYSFTVRENAQRFHILGSVHARNVDPTNLAVISYSIYSGDPQGYFSLNPATAELSINSPPDYELYPYLILTIQAASGNPPLYGLTNVNVTIIDENDNTPQFPKNREVVVVPESTAVGSIVFVAMATDRDSGDFGLVRYKLVQNPDNKFSVHRVMGQVVLEDEISYNDQSSYEVIVQAFDRGSPSLKTNLTLNVLVQDVNDNGPQFNPATYQMDVSEATPISTRVVQVMATDQDQGINARITYTLRPSVDATYFAIFPDDGWVYTRQRLDYELRSEFILDVIASDNGSPPQNSSAVVRLLVTDMNDNSPQFAQTTYYLNLDENMDANTEAGQVVAEDRDSGINAQITYTLEGSSAFGINPSTGVITTTQSLDRERTASYDMTVTATDHGQPPNTAVTSVHVSVNDLNDNRPTFLHRSQYDASIMEEQTPGEFVAKVIAFDPDSGENGTITYSFESGGDHFDLDSTTGLITTKSTLDRERNQLYMISVIARDNGTPPLQSIIDVVVHIQDINDNVPVAERAAYTFTIEENHEPGSTVGQVRAHDPDAGDNGKIFYSIIDGNDYALFGINRTSGVIINTRVVDFELSSHYQLTVFLEDNGPLHPQTTRVTVNINVLDMNDNAPVFATDPIQFTLSENVAIGHLVRTFLATDADSGTNSDIRYSIQTPQPMFSIDEITGALTTTAEIDRESDSRFLFVVQATDQAAILSDRRSSTVTVSILVEDRNDNAPVFESRDFTHINEDEPVGYPILHVHASDADVGENSRLVYEIKSGNEEGRFAIESITGLLSVAHPLDREHETLYTLNITATDHGLPPLTSWQTLEINVGDVNDLPPHFDPSSYVMEVREGVVRGTYVGTVTAQDGDTGTNGDITFEIPTGIADNKFTVDASTGVIVTDGELDREAKDSYSVTVYARNGGFPVRYDVASVIVYVQDSNDHAPGFATSHYELSVPENEPASAVHVVVAEDKDIGDNSNLTYSIRDGNIGGLFELNSVTGQLSTTGPLDREVTPQYNLTIRATDNGVPSQSGDTVITVNVLDENDNDPVFTMPSYHYELAENTGIGVSLMTVEAVDADEGTNAMVQYSLDNSTLGLFGIDVNSGQLTTTGLFDFEKESQYIFQVCATDGGSFGPRSEKVQVVVDVTDINDNAPVFTMVPFRANLSLGSLSGAYVTRIVAEDKDSGDNREVNYRFAQPSAEFTLDASTGVVLTSVVMDTEGLYRLEVEAYDLGTPSLSTRGLVEVHVGNAAAVRLEFLSSEYAASVLEDESAHTQILILKAVRSDGNPAGQVTYSIISGNDDGAFEITGQSDSGILSVVDSSTLDYETTQQARLVVQAEAPSIGAVPLYGYATVLLNLLDANDNIPRFVQDKYTTSVWEGQAVGIYVIQVSANDADQGGNGQITYTIRSGNFDNAFNLDPVTGIVTTNAHLDREIRDNYKLTIAARDSGSPQLMGSATLKITVVDDNDSRPRFPPMNPLVISEAAEVGYPLVTVTANDADTYPTLTYQFTAGGNPDNKFAIDQFSGSITLAEPLDREQRDIYRLEVQASDSRYTDEITLVVRVRDENDNEPQFSQQSYQAALSELTPSGYPVLTVNATDADIENNAQIIYSMGVAPVQGFVIDPVTGAITTNQTINFNPAQPIIQLVVTATDHGIPPLSSVVAVRVQVLDINNNAPTFEYALYSASVDEDKSIGWLVTTVTAKDEDPSYHNQKIDYTIVSGNEDGKFEILNEGATYEIMNEDENFKSGDIVLIDALDRELVDSYTLIVAATDRGLPQRNSTAEIVIRVVDVNDHAPRFNQTHYVGTVQENATTNTSVVQVFASDLDEGRNAEILFDIKSGNEMGMFSINATSGLISVEGNLDHDTIPEVRMSVRATDRSADNPLHAVVQVIIEITDYNDNIPYFPFMMYLERVAENQPAGTSVFQAHAIDKDTGEYGQLTYAIIEGSGKDLFNINSVSGEVTTVRPFDYEKEESYRLLIRAVDKGGESVSVQAQVEITSQDDYQPHFDQKEYLFSVAQDAAVGTVVGTVHASDNDTGADGVVLYAFERSGEEYEHEFFAINQSTGIITVKKRLNSSSRRKRDLPGAIYRNRRQIAEGKDQFSLIVKASSGKQGSKEDRVSITLNIGPSTTPGGYAGLPTTTILAIVIPVVFLIILIIIILFFIARRRRRENRKKDSQPPPYQAGERSLSPRSYDIAFDNVEMGHSAMVNHAMIPEQPLTAGDTSYNIYPARNLYNMHRNNMNSSMEVGHLTRTDISEGNSASSGRGSTTVEDDEIRRINERSVSDDHTASVRDKVLDSGIQQDHEDGLSLRDTASDVMGSPREKNISYMNSASAESMHVFGEEGGGEAGGGMDIGNIIYARLDEVGAEEDDAIMDGTRAFGWGDDIQPSMAGSLSSIVNSDEELSGSYNWDYLLDWGPQFQPLAHVFAEIAKLKDDTVVKRQLERPQQKHKLVKQYPPPLLTNVVQGPIKPVAPLAMNNGQSTQNPQTLPRSPIVNESAFSAVAVSPDLSPSLSPLAPGSMSISPMVTSTGVSSTQSSSRGNSGSSTPQRASRNPRQVASIRFVPSFTGDEEEIQI
ncbi:protocadherin-16-like [Acanthaster planci]|uniref:Protocadherin-16-like n=1 Tax=Acanthaster planci TaxID=133434 RepID=A0A8B7YMU1_ACAPL|nr:protocadherin-16-like [Acanthaster planci]XP_022092789.1 protocadherin-16-like [Acanthaster planci]XP_022092790.1 protocadherin-16-like [Acanthaster planci]XP_022092791.1 protocadherin-16-like [Acanthaster planci]XP_022092793.1 protocadherin-16-like [Acanthaster planci]